MDILNTINSFVWGPPLMVLLMVANRYFNGLIRFITGHKAANRIEIDLLGKKYRQRINSCCTALAATVGTGDRRCCYSDQGRWSRSVVPDVDEKLRMATKRCYSVLAVKYRNG